jgi:iron complex transport system permease protein
MTTLRLPVWTFYATLVPLFVAMTIAGVMIGSTRLPASLVVRVIGTHLMPGTIAPTPSVDRADDAIVWLIRLPRVLVAAVVGAGLATAGVVMQSLLRNPLAEPGLTGVGPGAVLGAVIAFVSGVTGGSVVAIPVFAMVSAFGALLMVYAIAARTGRVSTQSLLLAGIAVGTFATATASFLLSINIVTWQVAHDIVFWMMGGLDSRTWAHVWLSAPFVLCGLVSANLQARTLDIFPLGEEKAATLGVDVAAARRTLLATSALLAGASIAVAGMVGFVGLVVPHAVRIVIGSRHRALLPASALAGATFLIACDLIARTVRPPGEVRLGVVTAICGAPLFVVLLMRSARA